MMNRAQYPAYHMKRRVLGWLCIGTANVLEHMGEGPTGEQPSVYLSAKEMDVWTKAHADIDKAERRLRALGKHLLKGEYGGH